MMFFLLKSVLHMAFNLVRDHCSVFLLAGLQLVFEKNEAKKLSQ